MLRQARNKSAGVANVEWIQADGARPPFAGQTFDFVSNQFSFHHVRDKPGLIRSVLRILRPGGQFVMTNICPREMPGWLIYRAFPAAWQIDLKDFMAHDDVVAHMERAGFTDVRVELNHLRPEQTLEAFVETVRRRDTCSQLIALSDADYASGLRGLEADMRKDARFVIHDRVCLLTIRAEK